MKEIRIIIASILVLLVAGNSSYCQKKKKYEDLLPAIIASDPTSAVATLKSYLLNDPLNASIFLQLGLIYEKRFDNSDPLREHRRAMTNLNLAKQSFEGATRLLNEKDVKKFKDQYINFAVVNEKGKNEVPYDSITSKISKSLDKISVFEQHVPGIYQAFTESYLHYYQANNKFTEIIGRYRTLKELYLLFNDELDQELEELKQHYDSALYFFEQYEERKSAYDIGYNQKLVINEIKVYRLDGLAVEINYLQDKIEIWNYASWVDNTRAFVSHAITSLRNELSRNERLINQRLERTSVEYTNDDFKPLQVSKELLFKLRKYDLRSVIEPLFLYKQAKHDLIYRTLLSRDAELDSLDVDRKLINYAQLVNGIKKSDTILSEVLKRNTFSSNKKYPTFINEFYGGMSGITQFANTESMQNTQNFEKYIDDIQQISQVKFLKDTIQRSFSYRKKEYSLTPDTIRMDSTIQDVPLTTHTRSTIDGSQYISGILRDTKSDLIKSFVSKINSEGKVQWMNEYILEMDSSIADSHTHVAQMEVIAEGCVVLLHGTHAVTNATMNLLLILDENGEEKSRSELEVDKYPRTLNYVERSNTFLITFKGEDYNENLTRNDEMFVVNYNVLGDKLWQSRKAYAGNVVSLEITESGFIVVGNFTAANDNNGRLIQNTHNETATIIYSWSKDGKDKGTLLLTANNAYYTNNVHKVSEHCINLFGSLNGYTKEKSLESDQDNLVHFIITKDLKVLSRNIQ